MENKTIWQNSYWFYVAINGRVTLLPCVTFNSPIYKLLKPHDVCVCIYLENMYGCT